MILIGCSKMWVTPSTVLVSGPGFWLTERVNRNFILQKRKGRGTRGLGSLLVQTWDSVLDTKPPPYRVLYQEEGSDSFLLLAACMTGQEAMQDWTWLETEVVEVVDRFEDPEEVTEFVVGKVSSLVAGAGQQQEEQEEESQAHRAAKAKLTKYFHIDWEADKLVCYYACTAWQVCVTRNQLQHCTCVFRVGCQPRVGSTSLSTSSPSTPFSLVWRPRC